MSDDLSRDDIGDTHIIGHQNAASAMNRIFERFMASYTPFGFHYQDRGVEFHPMPYRPDADDTLLLQEPWRIMLVLYEGDKRMVMGLDLYGDIILGRGESRPGRIILNLDAYGALELGVSREHAMLRPTRSKLFLIDQGSTNGTTLNGASMGRGVAMPIKDEDLIGLGSMGLMVRILGQPAGST